MTLAFWISLAVVALISTLTLRGTVRVMAKGADNGWDNALAYVLISGLMLWFPLRWLLTSGSWGLILLAPLLCWIVQLVLLKVIYQINPLHAWLVGVTHTVVATAITTSVAIGTGIVLAYILYGQIISDPVRIIRIILRLIGIEI